LTGILAGIADLATQLAIALGRQYCAGGGLF
jgi:hypothetical protein